MKLKFRAEPKDILIFVLFCILLLYLVAIGELNLLSILDDGSLWGFNPFPAFIGENLWPTLVFYTLALIAVFTSVSSYFFETEKGFGFETGKKDKEGYSRWLKDREMKKELVRVIPSAEHSDAAGIPLINNGKEIWVDNGEYHNLIIGSTGSGKTQITVLPMVHVLAKKGESMIITDPKGEIYEKTANMLREQGYNIILLNFRDPQKGNAWNPFSLPYALYKEGNSDKANEVLDDLALNILYDENNKNDPFWEKTSADYFTGLSLALFEDAKENEINLNSISLMTTVGEEKYAGSTYMKEYFSTKNPAGSAYINVSSTINAAQETKASILSVFRQKIKLFASRENLSEMLSHNDFDMKDIGRKKTAVFIIIQDEKKTYHSLATIFIKQCYETLIDVAQESPGGKLPYRTNFILDEFANMPPLKDVTTMVTAARSRNIRFNFIIQNFAQLSQVYGKENGDTIKGNCGNIVYLISTELSALEEISKMCGEVKSKEKDKTASTPLVTVSDLQHLKPGQIIVMRLRKMPFRTKMHYDYQMNWGKTYDLATYPKREKEPLELFDLKTIVEEKHKKKMDEIFGNMTNNTSKKPQKENLPTNDFDVNEIVKRIDARIAELEEEERQEKEALAKKETKKTETKKEVVSTPSKVETKKEIISKPIVSEEPKKETPKKEVVLPKEPIKEIPKKEVILPKEEPSNMDEITDDEFFDDFFSDED